MAFAPDGVWSPRIILNQLGKASSMHELSLMEAVRDQALEQAARHGGGRITAITLRIGSLAGVEPEALAMAFAVVMANTAAAAARLEIEPVAATCYCATCQAPFGADYGVCECPRCGTISGQLLRGRELQLVALELEDPSAAAAADSNRGPN